MAETTKDQTDSARPEHELEQELIRAEAQLAASIEHLQSAGVKLPDSLLDKSDWLTIKRYAEKHGISANVVDNWVSEGIIPEDSTRVIPELNDLRLIQDKAYR